MNNSNIRTFATLRIISETVDAQAITMRLQLTPSELINKGDPRGKSGNWPHSYWEITSKVHVSSSNLEDHLKWLIGVVENSAAELLQLKLEGVEVDVFCFWETPLTQGGIMLSSEILSKLGDLGLALGIDIYTG